MKKLILSAILLAALCVPVLAEDVKLSTEFSYTGEASNFNLYLNGSKVCSSGSGEVVPFTCDNVIVEHGVNMFTLTANDLDGNETLHSPPFSWTYSPTMGQSPTLVKISVNINGENIELVK